MSKSFTGLLEAVTPVHGKTDGGAVPVTGTSACKAWDRAFFPLNFVFGYIAELAMALPRA